MADRSKKFAATELGVSERTIDRLRTAGELRWRLAGRKVVIADWSINAYRRRQDDKAAALQLQRGHADFIDELPADQDDDVFDL